MTEEHWDKRPPPLPLVHLRWLWSASLVGGFAGALLWFAALLLLAFLPGKLLWFLHRPFFWIWGSLLLLSLSGFGILVGQAIAGFWSWSLRADDPDRGIARFSGAFALSASGALSASAAFLLTWRFLPHAVVLALLWPIAASGFQLLFLFAITPWFFFLKRARRLLLSEDGPIGFLLGRLIHEAREAAHGQIPRILIALHGSALGLSLWLSGVLKFLQIRSIQGILIAAPLLLAIVALFLLQLWQAQSALFAHLRNRVSQHIATHLSVFAHDLPSPPEEFRRLFQPTEATNRWLRIPWKLLARIFHPILESWSIWAKAEDPVRRLQQLLEQDVPGLALPLLLAGAQIFAAIIPLLLLR